MKKLNEKQKSKKGITLIALVVTIVVLLILASVSITAVFGDNGLLQMAKEAGEKTNEAVQRDKENIGNLMNYIKSLNWDTSKVTAVTTKDDGIVPVPKGFVASEIEGENTIKDGFVIYQIPDGQSPNWQEDKNTDAILDVQQEYNQFVWVPCTVEEYKNHNYSNRTNQNDDGNNLEDDNNGGWNTWYYTKYNDWTDEGPNEASVKKYGGFYIARYEAGVPSNAPFYVSKDEVDTKEYATDKGKYEGKDISNLKPVSKKGVQAWNCITQENAKTVSENMYKGSGSVNSQLVDGIAWDRTVTWISTNPKFTNVAKDSTEKGNYANNTGVNKIEVNDTLWAEHLYKVEGNTNMGWCPSTKYQYGKFISGYEEPWCGSTEGYTNYDKDTKYHYRHYVEMATGASENTKMNNIYDMAGNVYEWTTEYGFHGKTSGTKYAVRCGGDFDGDGTLTPVSFRNGDSPDTVADPVIGFRVVLYVK